MTKHLIPLTIIAMLAGAAFGCAAETPTTPTSDEDQLANMTLEEAVAMGHAQGKGDSFWGKVCNWFGLNGNGTCDSWCPSDSDCLAGEACYESSECGEGGMCHCNECVVADAVILSVCPEPPPGACSSLGKTGCYQRPDCEWREESGGLGDGGVPDPTFESIEFCAERATECPATGIPCTPECPASGSLHGVPCWRGNYNAETCECEPLADDCRVTGCDAGSSCQICWASWACIPDGAVC